METNAIKRISSIRLEASPDLPNICSHWWTIHLKKLTQSSALHSLQLFKHMPTSLFKPNGVFGQTTQFKHSIDTGKADKTTTASTTHTHVRDCRGKNQEQDIIEHRNSPWAANALTTAPILAYPTRNDQFIQDTDTSANGIGTVLSQVQDGEDAEDGEEKVIAYDRCIC
ncbi:unnamed protein product [Mytilus coruscus]|uniref:Reverse transcriptase/retrotransposon-derived protein RNase H-like domain-containing protein n=1 Tax=Mytilus coruscus TaxID=42192 RepID=A0A6J8D089_MYTCO|nr:unnamed protein product [Mytilus coruscus]